jgi:hypothetical protein
LVKAMPWNAAADAPVTPKTSSVETTANPYAAGT